jgi:two-component sensor histidine kinase
VILYGPSTQAMMKVQSWYKGWNRSATDICAVRNIGFQLKADEKFINLLLPLEHRKNIYLIFKEAINNAVKYAAPQHINASLTINGRLIQLKVTDDGIGFDPDQVIKGNGLKTSKLGQQKYRVVYRSILTRKKELVLH